MQGPQRWSSEPHRDQADSEMHPKKWLGQGCHWATWLLSARWKQAFRKPNTEKIENIEFKRGINSRITERQSKRILIFPHDELLQCFFCEMSNTKSFPLIVHLGVSLASRSLPRVTGHRYSPQQWSLLENQKSNQIHGVPAPNGLHFHCQGKQFCFLSILPRLWHLWTSVQGQARSPWEPSHQWPTIYAALPWPGQSSTSVWSQPGAAPLLGAFGNPGVGAVFGCLAATDVTNSDPDIPTQGRLVPPECHLGPCWEVPSTWNRRKGWF